MNSEFYNPDKFGWKTLFKKVSGVSTSFFSIEANEQLASTFWLTDWLFDSWKISENGPMEIDAVTVLNVLKI